MASTVFPNISKSVTLLDGTTYAYVHTAASDLKPTFLFLHGFPSTSNVWRHQIDSLSSAGYGVLAPDLLGYGDTDKPVELEAYSYKRMSGHVAEILRNEKLEKVIGVGHDWGSALLSYLAIYHPRCISALVFISVGYIQPGNGIDIDVINTAMEQAFGYATFGYWEFFNSADGAEVLDRNNECVTSLFYPPEPEIWKFHLGPRGAARSCISANMKFGPLPRWLTLEEVTTHNHIMKKGGYTGPLNWYKSFIRGIDAAANAEIPDARKRITLPTLLIVAEQDYITRKEVQESSTAQWVDKLRIERFDCGHWVQLEGEEKLSEVLVGFAGEVAGTEREG